MNLRAIRFGDYLTSDDGLILHEKNVAPAVPKTTYISVPGRDGDLDLTEASGAVHYQDRQASFTFLLTDGTHEDRVALVTKIMGLVHGQKLRIVDEDDYPDWYMIGRCKVEEVQYYAAYAELHISAVCDPWRYGVRKQVKAVTVSDSSETLLVSNRGFRVVCPTLTVTGQITVDYGEGSAELDTGTYMITDLKLKAGLNTLGVSGTGSLTVTFQEAIQ
jgi:hypothetical protein